MAEMLGPGPEALPLALPRSSLLKQLPSTQVASATQL